MGDEEQEKKITVIEQRQATMESDIKEIKTDINSVHFSASYDFLCNSLKLIIKNYNVIAIPSYRAGNVEQKSGGKLKCGADFI